MNVLQTLVDGYTSFAIGYFLVLNTISLVIVGVAAVHLRRAARIPAGTALDDVFANPLTQGVSVLVPAFNEEKDIVASVQSILALRYPLLEVVIADDGSTDGTFEALRQEFDLVLSPRMPTGTVEIVGEVRSVHVARAGGVVVVRKNNAGRRGDALNAALDYARHPLVCMMDAASVLEPDALLHVVRPFVDDPERVAASSAVVRPVNGCPTEHGSIMDTRAPAGWAARIQVVEYLRTFLLGRVGWSSFNSLMVVSGSFGLFRRDLVEQVGGLTAGSLAEDADLVTDLHRRMRREHRDYRIAFVPHPVCWTEVPETLASLGAQRRRWSHGLLQVLMRFRTMIGNPRYGRMGLVVLPYHLLFELLAPVVEVTGLIALGGGAALGMVPASTALMFALAAIGYGILLSVIAIVVDDMTYRSYRRWSDLAALFGAAVLQNVGFRQLDALWRLQGLVAGLSRRNSAWGPAPRVGFTDATAA